MAPAKRLPPNPKRNAGRRGISNAKKAKIGTIARMKRDVKIEQKTVKLT
jgi:hypothetical protein